MFRNISNNIATFEGDAIVNSLGAGNNVTRPGMVFCSILEACSSSKALLEKVKEIGISLPFGKVFETESFGLPCKRIIHVITPFRHFDADCAQMTACYQTILEYAFSSGAASICLPLLGTGANGYGSDEVNAIARRVCYQFSLEHPEMDIYLNIYSVEVGMTPEERFYNELSRGIRHMPEQMEPGSGYFSMIQHTGKMAPGEILGLSEEEGQTWLDSIGVQYGDSFAGLVRHIVKAQNKKKSKAEFEKILKDVWIEINSLVGQYKTDTGKTSDTAAAIATAKKKGVPTEKAYLWDTKATHSPEYEWKKSKNKKLKCYIWQRPNKAEILLTCLALQLEEKQAYEVYRFCGYALSPYQMHDLAFRKCINLIHKPNPWTEIVKQYRFFTNESIYDYKEERRKIVSDSAE